MSRILSELLGAAEPAFSLMIRDLEMASGGNGTDIRLATDIVASVRQKTKELGLDHNDSSGKELYHALLHLAKTHDEHLAKALGATDLTAVDDLLERIKNVPQKMGMTRTSWAIKHSVAKRLLSARPPKNILRILGYRSVDSMLKRENMNEVYPALRFCEEDEWFERFASQFSRLKPTDFEEREIEIITLGKKRWGESASKFIRANGHNLCLSHEMGAVLLLPLPVSNLPGVTITVLPLLLEAINEIRMYSAFFKLRQVRHNFGKIVADSVRHDIGYGAHMAGQPVHWRVLQKHFGKKEDQEHLTIFEPHLIAEDLNWRRAEEVLYRIEPSLSFWRGLEYAGRSDRELPLSFNLLDVAVSYINNLEYGRHSVYHLREALMTELFTRYMGHSNLEATVLSQLDSEMLAPFSTAAAKGAA